MELPGSSAEPQIQVLIVTHNSTDQVKALLTALWPDDDERATMARSAVTLVDSGSEDVAPLHALPVNRVVCLSNVGYGTAANAGMRASDADWVVVMNPDCRIEYRSLVALAQLSESLGVAVSAPLLVDDAGRELPHFASLPTPLWAREQPVCDAVEAGAFVEVASVRGAVMLLDRLRVLRLGGFDSGFFLYGEELDLCRRLRAAGGVVGFATEITAIHTGEGSSDGVDPAWRRAQRARGKARYMRKHYGRLGALQSVAADVIRSARSDPLTLRTYLAHLTRDPRAAQKAIAETPPLDSTRALGP